MSAVSDKTSVSNTGITLPNGICCALVGLHVRNAIGKGIGEMQEDVLRREEKESGQLHSCGPVIVSLGPVAADPHTKAKVKL